MYMHSLFLTFFNKRLGFAGLGGVTILWGLG